MGLDKENRATKSDGPPCEVAFEFAFRDTKAILSMMQVMHEQTEGISPCPSKLHDDLDGRCISVFASASGCLSILSVRNVRNSDWLAIETMKTYRKVLSFRFGSFVNRVCN